jgi:hypothetical protein
MTKLIHKDGRPTRAYWLLHSAAADDGVLPSGGNQRRRDEYNTLERLTKDGLAETRRSGPRGGIRYHITNAGMAALEGAAA